MPLASSSVFTPVRLFWRSTAALSGFLRTMSTPRIQLQEIAAGHEDIRDQVRGLLGGGEDVPALALARGHVDVGRPAHGRVHLARLEDVGRVHRGGGENPVDVAVGEPAL